MQKHKTVISTLLCAVFIFALFAPALYAATVSPMPGAPGALTGLSTKPGSIALDNARGRASITFTHDAPAAGSLAPLYPSDPTSYGARYTARIAKYYFDEHNKGYRGKLPARTFEDRRDSDFKPDGPFTVSDLPSGVIFDVYATNYMEYEVYPLAGSGQRSSGRTSESQPSNPALVFTGVQLDAQLVAFDQVRLIWDDIWYNDRRIYGYTLNIYTSGDADSRVLQGSIPIYQSQIGQSGLVTANEGTGKLEYIYNVPYAGRVYSFEVVPVLGDIPGLIAPERNGVVTIASRIAVVATKLFEDPVDDLITWEINWSNVTAGMGSDRRYTAIYTLSKMGGGVSYQVLQVINNLTSTILVTPRDPNDPENMNAVYEITAIVYADGEELYVGADMVTITSGPFTLRESETPYTPQAPNLVLEGVETDPPPASASLWWNIPKQVSDPDRNDLDVSYEIFLFDDPAQIGVLSDPDTAMNLAPNFTEDGAWLQQAPSKAGNELGYIFSIGSLAPNTTYYAAVRAVKTFVDVVNMSFIKRYSNISYVVFTTPPSGPFGQPPAPTAFELIKESVTTTTADFNVMTIWYEQRLEQSGGTGGGTAPGAVDGEWVWQPGYDPGGEPLPVDYRKLSFEAGDQIYLYYAVYEPGMDPEKPELLPSGNYQIATIASVDERFPALRIPVAGLTPNTIYIFWARAARPGQLMSYPSKTILVTTPPDPNTELETPVSPDFDIMFVGDVYVDLIWEMKPGYYYSIQYALSEDFGGAGVTEIRTSTADIIASGVGFYRVFGLTPDTLYYFRVRAEVSDPLTGQSKISAWSDSKPVRTRPPMPPAAPSGFGIKPGAGAITESSIFYEWHQISGLIYILEYSRETMIGAGAGAAANASEIDVGAVNEYNLTGLLSNHRYYARLYAFDPSTGLRSAPTYIVGARTLRSDSDYDGNVDITMPLTGEFVKIDAFAIEGVWHVKILGTDADRLAERILTDTYLDYVIDLSKPPRHTHTINITAEGKVFASLSEMRENLEIMLSDKSFVVRPNMLSPRLAASPAARRVVAYRYEILIGLEGGAGYVKPGGMNLKTSASGFEVNVLDGGVRYPITGAFGKGVWVVVPFTGAAWYTAGVTQGVYVGPDGEWQRLAASVDFNPDTRRGRIIFEHDKPGSYIAVDLGGRGLFTDVSGGGYAEYINKLGALGYTDARAGSAFRPGAAVTPAEASGMLYRAMGGGGAASGTGGTGGAAISAAESATMDDMYMSAAYKAGFIADPWQTELKIEEALALVARAYAVRAGVRVGNPAGGAAGGAAGFAPGLAEAPEPVRTYAQFALDNGLAAPVIPNPTVSFPAGRAATRGEMAVFICLALELLGEI
ncbi:MAG: hypothetical protein FWH01_05165 [Oscillospiraceae bacterium]|nr:hypothetical protein [Oscillospiraceae bacterium]